MSEYAHRDIKPHNIFYDGERFYVNTFTHLPSPSPSLQHYPRDGPFQIGDIGFLSPKWSPLIRYTPRFQPPEFDSKRILRSLPPLRPTPPSFQIG